ncbi:DUF1161 domain-containing protein [Pseudomonas sp. EL_65y_Pfl2_R95]|uniref:DUF1161 domain-containing protein n=1 Tax=Pseudomonas sp. EL_65y_Pfl2_R95 TaxID=3088698 RepID=UPI0030DB7A25
MLIRIKPHTLVALITLSAGLLGSAGAQAAVKPCDELKQEIEVKIQASGVQSYTLEVVPNSEVEDENMVVGSCDGGTKKIIYQRNDG